MKLDREFIRDLRKEANGDGSKEARVAFTRQLRATSKALSTPHVMSGAYDDAIKEYGRTAVAICTAVTIWRRRDRLDASSIKWAQAVLEAWTNKPVNILTAYIDDCLHPTRIEEYAGNFMKLTTEEA